jgi:hypothetical protein
MTQVAIRSPFLNTENRLCGPLVALGRDAPQAASRFRRWVGISGRSYLVSVYPIGQCPDYVDAVVIAVEGGSGACVWIGETGQGGEDLTETLRAAEEAGASEAHVHLLAGGAAERAAVVKDLDGRH